MSILSTFERVYKIKYKTAHHTILTMSMRIENFGIENWIEIKRKERTSCVNCGREIDRIYFIFWVKK